MSELQQTDYGWKIEGELSEEDQRRIGKVKWRKSSKNGLYLSAFKTKKEAYLCLKKLAKRYRHSGLHTNTVSDLCDQYQEKGIMFYPTQTGRWLSDVFNIEVKYTGYGKPKGKITTTITLDKNLKQNYLDQLTGDKVSEHKRSWFINTILKKHCGIEAEPVLAFMDGQRIDPNSKQKVRQKVSVMFFEDKSEVQALYFGKLSTETKKLIESLCWTGEANGLDELENQLNRLGYYTL